MRYELIVVFEDGRKEETVDNIQRAIGAIQIYLEMPDTIIIHLFDNKINEMIFDWCRD